MPVNIASRQEIKMCDYEENCEIRAIFVAIETLLSTF